MKLRVFLDELCQRNEPLFYFGLVCLLFSLVCLFGMRYGKVKLLGVSGWLKPFKFAVSIGVFCWTIGWIAFYLNDTPHIRLYSWIMIILFAYELIYIAIQGLRGQLSHYNISTPFFAFCYYLMAVAATIITVLTLLIALSFFKELLNNLPIYYLWAIRLGLLIFVIFSFQGFLMGSRMAHTIGAPDGSKGLPLLNWSRKFGDARVAHFIGMHALQLLPLLAYYVLKNTAVVFAVAGLYFALAVFTLLQALKGKPFM